MPSAIIRQTRNQLQSRLQRIAIAIAILFFTANISEKIHAHQKEKSGKKEIEATIRYAMGPAIEIHADPFFVNEFDYVRSNFHQTTFALVFRNYFHDDFSVSAQFFSVQSKSERKLLTDYSVPGYSSSILKFSGTSKRGPLHVVYGITGMVTFEHFSRTRADGTATPELLVIDTRRSQAYPIFGLHLLPEESAGFSATFHDHDSNLMYGWLKLNFWLRPSPEDKIQAGIELLNHQSFGNGAPDFFKPPSAAFIAYERSFGLVAAGAKTGFIINAAQNFNSGIISMSDRLYFEFSVSGNL